MSLRARKSRLEIPRRRWWLLAIALHLAQVPCEAQQRRVVSVDSPELPAIARGLPIGSALRIEGLFLELGQPAMSLELERFQVFAPDARVVVHGPLGDEERPAPDNAYFRGFVEDRPLSLALLTVRAAGGMRGLIADRGRYWVLAGGAAAKGPDVGLAVRQIDVAAEFADQAAGWSCSTGELDGGSVTSLLNSTFGRKVIGESRDQGAPSASYTARIGIETDVEFFNLFGDATDATDYIGDVIAYGSGIYDVEVDTSLEIETVSLWTGGVDPWTQSSSTCLLFEFGRYWNDNNQAIDRTIAHYFSGKSSGGGVAWLGVLCSGPFNFNSSGCSLNPPIDNYGGGYGYSGSLSGNFDINNPAVVWDIMVVNHEIGHNFNSPHTHCYNGIGGNPEPVDGCYAGQCAAGCYCGAPALPAGCPGFGQGCGTIMSYCHLLSGGLSNISLTFGTGHPYGIDPLRVPTRMNQHVVTTATNDPACLALVEPHAIFSDGFESGDTSAWATSVP